MFTIYVSENPGLKRNRPELLKVNAETILALPDFFTLNITKAVILPSSYHESFIPHYIEEEHTWLKYAAEVVNSSAEETPDDLGLTSFVFQSRQEGSVFEQPNTAVMQKHCIDLETAAKNHQIR